MRTAGVLLPSHTLVYRVHTGVFITLFVSLATAVFLLRLLFLR